VGGRRVGRGCSTSSLAAIPIAEGGRGLGGKDLFAEISLEPSQVIRMLDTVRCGGNNRYGLAFPHHLDLHTRFNPFQHAEEIQTDFRDCRCFPGLTPPSSFPLSKSCITAQFLLECRLFKQAHEATCLEHCAQSYTARITLPLVRCRGGQRR
jgi:hypothetical protein